MKKTITALLMAAICITTYAIDYKKFIEKHDVDQATMSLPNDDLTVFWRSCTENNMSFQKFLSNLDKKLGAEKETISNLLKMPKFNPQYIPYVANFRDEKCDILASSVGNLESIDVCILDVDEMNALSTYSDERMVVAINSGFFAAKGSTPEVVTAVLAHEYAHSVLMHIAQSEYADNKKKRTNKIVSGITYGLMAINEGASAYNDAFAGKEHAQIYDERDYAKVKHNANMELMKFHYKYAREQEFEADLVAYRFMEWAGYGGAHYIEMLKILEANNYDSYMAQVEQEDDDHPLLRDRIEFLNFVKNNPEIKNNLNKKIIDKQKKYEKYATDDIYR